MALVDYGSDSDDEAPNSPPVQHTKLEPEPASVEDKKVLPNSTPILAPVAPDNVTEEPPSGAPLVGPQRPPSDEVEEYRSPTPSAEDDAPPQSPYSANRALLQSLTLPSTIPTIQPSPPGSPKPSLAAKFEHFRSLKAQGIHFNEKLLRSPSLRNPNLLQKLTAFVGFDAEDQYASNLPKDLWDPRGFKKEAYTEELDKSQVKVAEAREKARLEGERNTLEFVGEVKGERNLLNNKGKDTAPTSAAERVMRGLDRQRKEAPAPRERERPTGGRFDRERDGRRIDDRDKKRRRSWSRSRSRDKNRGRDVDRERRYREYEYRDKERDGDRR
ncbi:HCNGP-like protein-domain-containing protein [Geopyxis carbonaria]|nr:HCNGP-like protein-domain-containing protein [Geopyxis carbonaria]